MQKRGAGVADFREEERQILGSVLPNVAAALRTPLNNLHMAAERIARQLPDDGLEGAVLQQSYHRLLRLVSNLSMGPELLSEQPFQLQNLELVAWLGDLCQQAASAADALGIGLSFTCRERYLVAAVHRVEPAEQCPEVHASGRQHHRDAGGKGGTAAAVGTGYRLRHFVGASGDTVPPLVTA